jgi:hypothetical protein
VTAAVVHPLLAELETRAGASDQDRELWLAERRAGITATEVRDLYMGKVRAADLIALKLGRKVDTFTGNDFTRWGTEREPVIAEMLERLYGIRPESRVFRAADNARFLASPDGVGVDPFDGVLVVSEIKTSGKSLGQGSEAFARTGYLAQMTWAMRVTGARVCRFACEERISVVGRGFVEGVVDGWEVFYDEALAGELEVIASQFLADMDAAAQEPWDPQDHSELELLVAADSAAQAAAQAARAAVAEYVAAHRVSSWKGAAGSVSYALPKPSQRFDSAAFKAAHPDLHKQFLRESVPSKPTLRITPAKSKESK